ncbi:MAG: hypothetical protein PF541_01265 [Prolixibacteraceae bacterium]|jgi:hypothetical protein|nr:hypothetical protein [Prolixibacteraceae bacterium]
MKPLKSGISFAKWMLRITLVIYLVAYYYGTLLYIDFLDVSFVFALIYIIAAGSLLVGGFKKKDNITVYSSLMLLIAVAFNIYLDVADGIYGIINHLLPLSIAFFFLSNGNK